MQPEYSKTLRIVFSKQGNILEGRFLIYLPLIEQMEAVYREKPYAFYPFGWELSGNERDFSWFVRDYELFASLIPDAKNFLHLARQHNIAVNKNPAAFREVQFN